MVQEIGTGKVKPVDIEEEMKYAYLGYAMSVIVGRALPDVRDGLKPVHRRILYAMNDLGLLPDKGHKKSARIVGEVLGKYHPHGDTAVYDTMVRMAQQFSYRYLLVDGQGNFGSVDGDSPAAMRYTEARMTDISIELLRDIEKETVDFQPNFDDSLKEPVVLPSRFPNLLVNGASGIAVGMSTSIPPHNLGEIIDGVVAFIDDPDISWKELLQIIKGPDFPTGGILMGRNRIFQVYTTGKGRLILRSQAAIEEENNRSRIVVTEIPYQVNKARLIEEIAELVKQEKLDGISDLRDESDRQGMRIVIELKRSAIPSVVLNRLFKNTRMEITYSVILLALVNGEPRILNLKEALHHYIQHQKDVITRRTRFDLQKAQERAHILEGLQIALDHIDEVIALIRSSRETSQARDSLMYQFSLTEKQAQAILNMRLQRLTGLEREKIDLEIKELVKEINYLEDILAHEKKLLGIIKEEVLLIKERFSDSRRTQISEEVQEIDIEDLIQKEEMVITLTNRGYIKRVPLNEYRSQHRGGRGTTGLATTDGDFVEKIFIASTHHYFLFFTNFGQMYTLKVFQIPEGGRRARGSPIVNLLEFNQDERISAVIPIQEFHPHYYLVMATRRGMIKKTALINYQSRYPRLKSIHLNEGDELIDVKLMQNEEEIVMGTSRGLAIRFRGEDIRASGRITRGVKGITVEKNAQVIGMDVIRQENTEQEPQLLVITEKGYGKKTPLSDYRLQGRRGKGLKTIRMTEKSGNICALRVLEEGCELMIITQKGIMIRISSTEIPSRSRITQGVKLIRLAEEDCVVAVANIGLE